MNLTTGEELRDVCFKNEIDYPTAATAMSVLKASEALVVYPTNNLGETRTILRMITSIMNKSILVEIFPKTGSSLVGVKVTQRKKDRDHSIEFWGPMSIGQKSFEEVIQAVLAY